jgi:two-component system CheB/CheR fusion protein
MMLGLSMLPGLSMNSQHLPFGTTAPLPLPLCVPAMRPGAPTSSGSPTASRTGTPDDSMLDAAGQASALWRQAVHDLRGKLGVVTNVTALLQTTCRDPRQTELLGVLERNVCGLRDLLNGMAELARLDARRERPALRVIDVAAALDDTCRNLRVLAASRGVQLDFRGPASLIAESDPLMVARIAQNLVLNAIQYAPAGTVVLTCGTSGAHEAEPWYFEVGNATTAHPRGARALPPAPPVAPAMAGLVAGEGIGLSIVGRLCSLLGGTVEVARDEAGGRTTRIRLPRQCSEVLQDMTIAALGGRRASATGLWALAGVQRREPRLASPPAGAAAGPMQHS